MPHLIQFTSEPEQADTALIDEQWTVHALVTWRSPHLLRLQSFDNLPPIPPIASLHDVVDAVWLLASLTDHHPSEHIDNIQIAYRDPTGIVRSAVTR